LDEYIDNGNDDYNVKIDEDFLRKSSNERPQNIYDKLRVDKK
jgi:hypothetical protein